MGGIPRSKQNHIALSKEEIEGLLTELSQKIEIEKQN